jgi:hypothetical protein
MNVELNVKGYGVCEVSLYCINVSSLHYVCH